MTGRAFALLFVTTVACGRGADPGASPSRGEAPSTPASADEMCAEHGVLEALCTKCNPRLATVFQAKGDWCAEHGFPESICPICHPERGGRPAAADVSTDDGPADGTKIRFKTRETARRAGLETAPVEARSTTPTVEAPARIVHDATRVAVVNARTPGVVQAIRAEVGARVERGTPLAVLESAGVGADQSRLVAARAHVEVARANHSRETELRQKGITSDRDVLAARQELSVAEAELASVRASLGMIGGTNGSGRYTLTAPQAGVVTKRTASVGRLVDTSEPLFEIVDTSIVWIEISVSERDLSRIAVGRTVTVVVEALGALGAGRLSATVDYISPEIDPHTRTVLVRAALPNPDGLLRANMLGTASIAVEGPHAALLVPRSAVQRAGGVSLVFAQLGEQLFEARRVRQLGTQGALVEIEGRLQAGDRVVTEGSFLLKTEVLPGSIGAGCCETD
jgi:cobalt-zinc-cadmium efflux system membrane fusion protein